MSSECYKKYLKGVLYDLTRGGILLGCGVVTSWIAAILFSTKVGNTLLPFILFLFLTSDVTREGCFTVETHKPAMRVKLARHGIGQEYLLAL